MTTFYSKFISLCADNKILPGHVCDRIGIGRSAASKWKRGILPTDSTICKLAEFFGVDPSEFGMEAALHLSRQETAIIEAYRKASADTRRAVRKVLGVSK